MIFPGMKDDPLNSHTDLTSSGNWLKDCPDQWAKIAPIQEFRFEVVCESYFGQSTKSCGLTVVSAPSDPGYS